MKNAAVKKKAPTPELIDVHAAAYQNLQDFVTCGKADVKKKKAALMKLVRKHGQVPEGAEKSKRLLGIEWQITASFGTSSSVDEEVVELIRIELALADLPPRYFAELFQKETSHIVLPEAKEEIKKLPKKIQRLFAKVVKTETKEPSLKVEKLKK